MELGIGACPNLIHWDNIIAGMFLRARGEVATFTQIWSTDSRGSDDEAWRAPAGQSSSLSSIETQEMLQDGNLLPKRFETLGHGDLFRESAERYRAADIFVVDRSVAPPIVHWIADDSHGRIPVTITSKIEDPESFYAAVQEECDIAWLDLSAGAHAALTRELAGGREVAPVRKVRCSYNEPDTGQNTYRIEGPMSEDIASEHPLWVPLNASTPLAYLSAVARLKVDPIMELCRAANRAAHAGRASTYLAQMRLTSEKRLSLCSPPTDRPIRVWAVSTGQLLAVVESHSDPRVIESIRVRSAVRDIFTCRPRVLTQKGPFGGVPVWCEEGPAPRWMIDLTELADLPDYE